MHDEDWTSEACESDSSLASECEVIERQRNLRARIRHRRQPGSNPGRLQRPPASFSLEDLQAHYQLSLSQAARQLEISTSTLKRVCRKHGVKSWPRRKLQKYSRAMEQAAVACCDLKAATPMPLSDVADHSETKSKAADAAALVISHGPSSPTTVSETSVPSLNSRQDKPDKMDQLVPTPTARDSPRVPVQRTRASSSSQPVEPLPPPTCGLMYREGQPRTDMAVNTFRFASMDHGFVSTATDQAAASSLDEACSSNDLWECFEKFHKQTSSSSNQLDGQSPCTESDTTYKPISTSSLDPLLYDSSLDTMQPTASQNYWQIAQETTCPYKSPPALVPANWGTSYCDHDVLEHRSVHSLMDDQHRHATPMHIPVQQPPPRWRTLQTPPLTGQPWQPRHDTSYF